METHNCCVVVGCGGIYTVYTQYRVQLQDQNSHFCVAGVAWILSRQTKDKESGANICAYTYIHEHDTRKAWEDSSGRWQTCKTVQIFAKNATSRQRMLLQGVVSYQVFPCQATLHQLPRGESQKSWHWGQCAQRRVSHGVAKRVGDAANYCPYSAMPTIAKSSLV